MHCTYFEAGRCRSCTLLEQPYPRQLAGKQAHVEELLAGHHDLVWLPPVPSRQEGFRNKAKMVVTGSVDEPSLGILRPDGSGQDLRDCPLHTPGLHAALPVLADFVTRARITPYDVPQRRGELKHLLVTESPDGELMVRFVLRSQEPVTRIRKHLPSLLAALPQAVVVSVNLQPEHKAVLEGDREILLTDRATLRMRVNGLDLHLRPQSFFQTNTEMASALYRQATEWVAELAPASVWDLYCGVGGFALHAATSAGPHEVVGIEASAEAIESARQSTVEAGLTGVRFEAGDATAYAVASSGAPELIVVNPPRRGIGDELSRWLDASSVGHVLYSSCNAASLARDLAAMPALVPKRGRVLDMFPNTDHYELLVRLERR
ncbi:23S rRNA (uracil(747)-C(5))-methyltransferase RlmC [Nocardioides sp. MAHUQ-72]|uniref:23S rRNA (uracil(747)-C(5))-methyltransferase RlmC n=1 Tax=unclassified Nocardioides TaxID=2615069 RepID=UPI0036210499